MYNAHAHALHTWFGLQVTGDEDSDVTDYDEDVMDYGHEQDAMEYGEEPDVMHTGEVSDAEADIAEGEADGGSSISHDHLSFPYPESPEIMQAKFQYHSHIPDCLVPDHGQCRCGGVYARVIVDPTCKVYYPPPKCARIMQLFKLRCGTCGKEILYDGTKAGLFLYSKDTCVSLEILYAYARSLSIDGRSMSACWADVAVQYVALREINPAHSECLTFCSESHYRKVVYAWLGCLNRPYLFQCPLCKDTPDVLIGDATSESIQASRYVGQPITTPRESDDPPVVRPHTRMQRCFMSAADDRVLLGKFAKNVSQPEFPLLDDDDWLKVLDAAEGCGLKRAVEDVHAFCVAQSPDALEDRDRVGAMLACLSSDSPTLSYIPVDVAMSLGGNAGQGFTPACVRLMLKKAPIFFAFCTILERMSPISPVAPFGSVMQARHQQLLDELVARTAVCSTGGPLEVRAESSSIASSTSAVCMETGICCGVPQVRYREKYALDSKKESNGCRHKFVSGSKGSRRTGGIFTWFCQHGICYAFYVIPKAEGRNEAFSFLYQYFEVAPKVVVYDFACALQDYCLNRQPEHFKHTAFLVDRFHWFNHRSCARSYNLSIYHEYCSLNSQIAEQVNSHLKKIKSSVSQMTQDNFIRCVRFYLEMINERKEKLLLAALSEAPAV
jgi:CxC4 like cysteine cluster associated with KDZ transposases/Kyakuja-Dileera-Zisupton transposase